MLPVLPTLSTRTVPPLAKFIVTPQPLLMRLLSVFMIHADLVFLWLRKKIQQMHINVDTGIDPQELSELVERRRAATEVGPLDVHRCEAQKQGYHG